LVAITDEESTVKNAAHSLAELLSAAQEVAIAQVEYYQQLKRP
jgi:hypothetical protein